MKKGKRVISKYLSWLLVFLLVIGITPVPAFAAEDELWVNGVNILKEPGGSVPCGTGTAAWDHSSRTLTLTDAKISVASASKSRNAGIYYSGTDKLNIVVNKTNTIDNTSSQSSDQIRYGIYSEHSPISVTGNGTLDITVTSGSGVTGGGIIYSEGVSGGNNIHIQDITLICRGRNVTGGLVGVCTSSGSLNIQNTNLSFSGNLDSALRSERGGDITITNSNLSIKQIRGNLIACNNNFTIKDSVLTAEGKTANSAITVSKNIVCSGSILRNLNSESNCFLALGTASFTNKSDISGSAKSTGLYGDDRVTIDDSKVNLTSTDNCAVYSSKNLSIVNHSEVTASGLISAVRADGDQGITVKDSRVSGVSKNEKGIESRGLFTIEGKSEVKATGGKAAVSAICTQIAGEPYPGKAILMDEKVYYEESGGKLAVSDWEDQGKRLSFTSFVAGNESGPLKPDLSNALKSVSVKLKKVAPPTPSIKVSGVKLNKKSLILYKGKSEKLKASVSPSNASNKSVSWKSSNPKAVKVDAFGKITAVTYGKAKITASAKDGSKKNTSCTVTVPYRIRYHLNKGKNHKSNRKYYYNEKVVLNKPKRKGYQFKGWYRDKKLKERKITKISKGTKKNYSVFAKWKKIKVGTTWLYNLQNKKSKTITIRWKKISGVKGYQLKYSTNKKFKNAKAVTRKGRKATLKKLKAGKKYYIRVRGYKLDSAGKRVYGKYSKKMTWRMW